MFPWFLCNVSEKAFLEGRVCVQVVEYNKAWYVD